MNHPTASRRRFLQVGGAAVLGAVLTACGDDSSPAADADPTTDPTTGATASGAGAGTTAAPAEATTLTAADFADLGTCRLTPEQTEGPFYLGDELVRRDITEGLTGHPLRVGVQVVDAACDPVPGAVVDIWHADVDGDYSAYADGQTGRDGDGADGTTFLRGSQVANDEGIVEFATLYPGWYPGRTVHIHTKVHLDGATKLTSQLYFPEDISDAVFAEDPYAASGERDTTNATDGIASGAEQNGTLLTLRPEGDGHLALIVAATP